MKRHMKKIYILGLILFTGQASFSQVKMGDIAPVEAFQMKENAFDFGRIPQGKPVNHHFLITNIGKEPLVIENVLASCGCTTPEWSPSPVSSGKTTEIKVGYNAAVEGSFEKSITVMYNKGQTKTFVIRGHVWKLHEQTAPHNNSVSLLKNVK